MNDWTTPEQQAKANLLTGFDLPAVSTCGAARTFAVTRMKAGSRPNQTSARGKRSSRATWQSFRAGGRQRTDGRGGHSLGAQHDVRVAPRSVASRARKSGFPPKPRRGWRKSGVACSCGWRVTTDGGLSPARVPQATEGGAAAFAHASPQGDRAPSLESVRRLRETRRLHV